MWRLASDIGGTFTDLVYFNETTGDLGTAKSLTTPRELTQGVIDTIRPSQIDPGEVGFFVHGGTTVINVITERKGAKTALITTAGFRDVLEIARGNRPDLYNLRFEKEPPIVRRRYRFEVRERVDARGKELEPLHLEDLDPIIARCRSEGIEAIAIQSLHSYALRSMRPFAQPTCARDCQRLPSARRTRLRARGASMRGRARRCSTRTCSLSCKSISTAPVGACRCRDSMSLLRDAVERWNNQF